METSDIWFAGYLKFKGVKLVEYSILSKNRGRYRFDISKADYHKCKIEFLESELESYKRSVESIKDLLH